MSEFNLAQERAKLIALQSEIIQLEASLGSPQLSTVQEVTATRDRLAFVQRVTRLLETRVLLHEASNGDKVAKP